MSQGHVALEFDCSKPLNLRRFVLCGFYFVLSSFCRWTLHKKWGLKNGYCLVFPLLGFCYPKVHVLATLIIALISFLHYTNMGTFKSRSLGCLLALAGYVPKWSRVSNWHVNHCAWSKGSWGGAPLYCGNQAVDVKTGSDGPFGMLACPSPIKDSSAGSSFWRAHQNWEQALDDIIHLCCWQLSFLARMQSHGTAQHIVLLYLLAYQMLAGKCNRLEGECD